MMDYEELTKQFKAKVPVFEQLREEALYALSQAIKVAGIKYHSFHSRVKELDSFLEKVRSREAKENLEATDTDWNPLEAIHDVVGLRVVCLYLSDLTRIAVVIRDTFEVLSEDNKIEGAEVSSFGYMSIHFIAVMKKEYTGPRYDNIARLSFEIQVRTIAMDAWANVSHHLDYKSDKDVPAELRKDFYALSGLFYVADRHFEMFYSQSKQSRSEMKELFKDSAINNESATQELNLDSLSAYLESKLPERERSPSKEVSKLLKMLLASGYKTIGNIEEAIEKAKPAFRLYEQQNPPVVPKGETRRFTNVGVVRITLELVDEAFLRESRRDAISDEEELEKTVESAWKSYRKYRDLVA